MADIIKATFGKTKKQLNNEKTKNKFIIEKLEELLALAKEEKISFIQVFHQEEDDPEGKFGMAGIPSDKFRTYYEIATLPAHFENIYILLNGDFY